MPQLWVVAGPNGAGKSTLANKYLAGRLPIVNPDVIAQALAPTDLHGTQVRVQAGREAVRRQESLLAQGVDFAIETTLSGNRELALMRRARDAGYKVTLVYVGVDTPTTTLGRIAQRVARGGHTVPQQRSTAFCPQSIASGHNPHYGGSGLCLRQHRQTVPPVAVDGIRSGEASQSSPALLGSGGITARSAAEPEVRLLASVIISQLLPAVPWRPGNSAVSKPSVNQP